MASLLLANHRDVQGSLSVAVTHGVFTSKRIADKHE